MKIEHARSIAEDVVRKLSPFCSRIEIAGSIRRGKLDVHDIEIVCMPNQNMDMFLNPQPSDEFNAQISKLVKNEKWTLLKRGPRYKQIDLGEIKVDLFIVIPPAQWGVIMAIRTGSAKFSQWLVTNESMGGALPDQYRVHQGCVQSADGVAIFETPEEEDFFRMIGVPFPYPHERTDQIAEHLFNGRLSKGGMK